MNIQNAKTADYYSYCNNNAIFSDRAIFKFPAVYVCRPQGSLGSSCQTEKMAGVLNSIFVVLKISFLPIYIVSYTL